MTSGLPRWVEIGLLPLINLALAFLVAGAVIALIGEDPLTAEQIAALEQWISAGAVWEPIAAPPPAAEDAPSE